MKRTPLRKSQRNQPPEEGSVVDPASLNIDAATNATATAATVTTTSSLVVLGADTASTASCSTSAASHNPTAIMSGSDTNGSSAATAVAHDESLLQAMQRHIDRRESQLKCAYVKISESDLQCRALKEVVQNSTPIVTATSSSITEPSLPPWTPLSHAILSQQPNPSTVCSNIAVQPTVTPSTLHRSLPSTSIGAVYTSTNNCITSTIQQRFHHSPPHAINSNNWCLPINQPQFMPPGRSQAGSGTLPQTIPYTNARKVLDLPDFSGHAEDWPMFCTAYTETTSAYNYSNLENSQRLLKCLKGEARETVKSLLIHPDNVDAVMEQLRFRFGRPEQLIRSQLQQVRGIPAINENSMERIISFATKTRNLAAFLQSANGQHHLSNPTLLEELILKLPMSKRIEWAKYAISIQPYPTITHFSKWLSEVAELICSVQDIGSSMQTETRRRPVLHAAIGSRRLDVVTFPLCQGQHKICDCKKFSEYNKDERWNQAKRMRLCFTCLEVGHSSRMCRRRKVCGVDGCQRSHHKLLHEPRSCANESVPFTQLQHNASISKEAVLTCAASTVQDSKLLFRVLPVTLFGTKKRVDTYALLDEGSSITIMDAALIEELELEGHQRSLNLQWLGGRTAKEPATVVSLHVSGLNVKRKHILRNVYAVSNLQLPTQSLSDSKIYANAIRLRNLPVQPYIDVTPKLLIGLDHCHLGLTLETIKIDDGGPFAAKTELGWVIFGPFQGSTSPTPSCLMTEAVEDTALHKLVEDYFDADSFGVRPAPLVEDKADVRARSILQSTTIRIKKRFQTGLLWKSDDIELPDSYAMAKRRLVGIERKMKKDDKFAAAYNEIIESYISKGYARKLSSEEASVQGPRTWYLPHFAVSNHNKPGKFRLVFDAAAAVEGISLNSCLLKGPQQYQPMPVLLFNFRIGRYAVCGDIREMFHQVLIQPEDRNSQRFLWRSGEDKRPPDIHEMMVMTFGAACSPSAAQFVLKLNAQQHHDADPRAVRAILQHHYVDDYVDSFESMEEAISIAQQVRQIHREAGFELRGFVSNSPVVTCSLEGEAQLKKVTAECNRSVDENQASERVLGMFWHPFSDTFAYQLKFHRVNPEITTGNRCPSKRELLSIVMSVFDPLGFLCNVLIGAKLLMRELWKCDVRWDEPLPSNINAAWCRWFRSLSQVAEIRIPRHYFNNTVPKQIQLHIFVDASEDAFAVVAYWRAVDVNGNATVAFVCAKTKCAPLKPMTIPRLELQAAVLGTRLMQTICKEHLFAVSRCLLWSDSKTVTKWIKSANRRYKPFVAHRVAEILAATEESNWKWLPTEENVADEATRSSHNCSYSGRWLTGPKFLWGEPSAWPTGSTNTSSHEEDAEELRPKFTLLAVSHNFINFHRFRSLNRLKRSIAWVIRFTKRSRQRYDSGEDYGLIAAELNVAESVLCRQAQGECYSTELMLFEKGQNLTKWSALHKLSPYVDDAGVLRVNGRIDAASWLPFSTRHPIILPPDHLFTKLVVRHYHCEMKHQNFEATICEVRRHYWVPRLRQVLRGVVASCFICRAIRTMPVTPIMGPLPKDRLTPYMRPFSYTGLDYFGPINVTIGSRQEKRWVALFTCLVVRAIHLKVAFDLSTDACIVAIRHFINRRGVPVRIRSDNGKNFVGAEQEARRFTEVFDCERIQNELSNKGVEWVFNCPNNPSEGGTWERMVQCVKKVLRDTMKEVAPREHTLQCLLIEAENIVNSRPLTHLSVTADQEEPLTPNHFLLGEANTTQTPSLNEPTEKLCVLRKQWRIARQLRDRFWKRWICEYLPTLTRRSKWCQRTAPPKEGDLVLICDVNLPRRQWSRGRIERVYHGVDGEVRRADVRTSSGVLRRPVSKLAVLSLEDSESD